MNLLITTQTVDKNDPILGFFHDWIGEFAKHFERIHVICMNEGSHTFPENVYIHSLGKESGVSKPRQFFRFYRAMFRVFSATHIDFVFFHMGAIFNILSLPFFFFRKFTHTEYLWWKTHGKSDHLKERVALHACDHVVTASDASFPFETPKKRVIGHAINTSFFNLPPTSHSRSGLLFVGRRAPIKKVEVALRVMKELATVTPDTTLTVVGGATSASYEKVLHSMVREFHIEDCLKFKGALSRDLILSCYQTSEILLHPAYEAGLDKVVLEAMSCGVIPVTSIPSFRDILSPYGLYVHGEDTSRYVKVVTKLLSLPQRERDMLGAELRGIVVAEHSLTTITQRIFNI